MEKALKALEGLASPWGDALPLHCDAESPSALDQSCRACECAAAPPPERLFDLALPPPLKLPSAVERALTGVWRAVGDAPVAGDVLHSALDGVLGNPAHFAAGAHVSFDWVRGVWQKRRDRDDPGVRFLLALLYIDRLVHLRTKFLAGHACACGVLVPHLLQLDTKDVLTPLMDRIRRRVWTVTDARRVHRRVQIHRAKHRAHGIDGFPFLDVGGRAPDKTPESEEDSSSDSTTGDGKAHVVVVEDKEERARVKRRAEEANRKLKAKKAEETEEKKKKEAAEKAQKHAREVEEETRRRQQRAIEDKQLAETVLARVKQEEARKAQEQKRQQQLQEQQRKKREKKKPSQPPKKPQKVLTAAEKEAAETERELKAMYLRLRAQDNFLLKLKGMLSKQRQAHK